MIGAVLAGRFELTGLLAEGPIFSLYSARDRQGGRDVSLRILKPPFDREKAFKSALTAAVEKNSSVQNPNVERLIELYSEDDEAYIVGDLTRAPSLADRIRKLAPFTSPVAVAAAIGIARGLDGFHRANLVHGDVSAETVAMMADGDTRLQLGGIWEAYSASQTAGSVVLPALAPYLAPEVSAGGMPSKRSDVYSLGILLYELLAGRKPYMGDSPIATAMRHSSEPTPRVRSISPSVPVVLDEVVNKAMCKDPLQRYPTAGELLSDLRQVQDAMRFGQKLNWPLGPQGAPQSAGRAPSQYAPAQGGVAPRMSAIRVQPAPERPGRESRDRDVPIWMSVLLAISGGAAVLAVLLWLGTNLVRPRLVTVPNLEGLSVTEARDTLTRQHLKLKVGSAVPNERYDPDHIVTSNPLAGDKVSENSSVQVTLSSGRAQVEVPDLRQMTPDKARSVLATLNLSLDPSMDHDYDPALPEGTISKQTPSAGAKVDRNQQIHVSLNAQTSVQNSETPNSDSANSGNPNSDNPSAGNPNPDTQNPEITGSGGTPTTTAKTYTFTPTVKLSDITAPVEVRLDVTDDQGTRTFYDKMGNPGDSIRTSVNVHGPQATFQIYYNGLLRKTLTKNATDG